MLCNKCFDMGSAYGTCEEVEAQLQRDGKNWCKECYDTTFNKPHREVRRLRKELDELRSTIHRVLNKKGTDEDLEVVNKLKTQGILGLDFGLE